MKKFHSMKSEGIESNNTYAERKPTLVSPKSTFLNTTVSIYTDWMELFKNIVKNLAITSVKDDELSSDLQQRMKRYAKEGLMMFQQNFYEFISTRQNQLLPTIRLRKVSISSKKVITEKIKEVFDNIGTIMAIKLLLYEGTPIQSD
ncbi:15673_t:CDS:2 [Cetraspora pellucida]|uniref:15673_t:CDS:1 n=1 Tax=Cetraspora pellucida TaxID=1433469 RepID=A0A9N9BX70_9GLOM|nr:15673_t:CDS:2 [Cetraspora pellucida]